MQAFFLLLIGSLLGHFVLGSKPQQDELLFVQVIWRHGSRAPSDIYPRNPNTIKEWPLGLGQLTAGGMDQLVELGNVLRKQYIEREDPLLSPYPVSGQYLIRSTHVDRTMASASAVAAGFFPKPDGGAAKHYFIPVKTTDLDVDSDLNVFIQCPRANELRAASFQKLNAIEEKHQWFYKLVKEKTGKLYKMENIFEVYDNYLCDGFNKMKPAEWLTPAVLKVLKNITLRQIDGILGLPLDDKDFQEFTRLRGGRVMKTLVNKISQRIKCHKSTDEACSKINKQKFIGYSAHDVTIAHLMMSLTRDFTSLVPGNLIDYTGSVSFELWKKNGKFSVRILLRPKQGTSYKSITAFVSKQNSSEFWDFENFLSRVTPFMPTDHTAECVAKNVSKRGKRQPIVDSSVDPRFPEWDVEEQTKMMDFVNSL